MANKSRDNYRGLGFLDRGIEDRYTADSKPSSVNTPAHQSDTKKLLDTNNLVLVHPNFSESKIINSYVSFKIREKEIKYEKISGVENILKELKKYKKIRHLYLMYHGAIASVYFGGRAITLSKVTKAWRNEKLPEIGNIVFLGCRVGAKGSSQTLMDFGSLFNARHVVANQGYLGLACFDINNKKTFNKLKPFIFHFSGIGKKVSNVCIEYYSDKPLPSSKKLKNNILNRLSHGDIPKSYKSREQVPVTDVPGRKLEEIRTDPYE